MTATQLSPETRKQVEGMARRDMGKARKGSGIYVSQTQKGLIDLRYDAATKLYRFSNGHTGELYGDMTAAESVRFIVEELFVYA